MEIVHGTWGERVITRRTDKSLSVILYLKPNKRCSWHFHKHSYNQFYVIEGELTIITDIGPEEHNKTTITERQCFTVQPGVKHEFRTGDKKAIVQEIAYVEYDIADINRERPGGDCEQKR